ncbi:MAG: 3-dehydroquinate synthase [Planctomycetota bacterium]
MTGRAAASRRDSHGRTVLADGHGSDAFDVDFAVPCRHQLRFTADVFGRDRETLWRLLEPGGDSAPKVLAYCDDGPASADPTLLTRLSAVLEEGGVELCGGVATVPGGEASKHDPSVVERVLADIDRHGLDRRSYVLVCGGGAVLDAVGYAAAIAHRGLRLVRLPTTTLAQADSGVGVKNAVNLFGQKNWCGTFAVPWGVINDAAVLRSLSDRDFVAGFSEAVKVALLKSPKLFRSLTSRADLIADRDDEVSAGVIRESALLHLRHITAGGDPFEALEARPLDFGHWSAHRLEGLSGHRLRHGEAVSIGLAIDVAYSAEKLGLAAETRDAVLATLRTLRLPTWDGLLDDPGPLWDGLEDFRRHLGGRLTLTMIRDVGDPVDVHEVDRAALNRAIAYLRPDGD